MLSPHDAVFKFFLEEASEHLAVIDAGLLQLQTVSGTPEDLLSRLYRAAHTLKGAANLVKLTSVGAIAHDIEDIFEAASSAPRALAPAEVDWLLTTIDQVRRYLHDLGREGDGDDAPLQRQHQQRVSLSPSSDCPAAADEASPIFSDGPLDSAETEAESGGLPQTVRVNVKKINDLVAIVGEFTLLKNRLLERLQSLDAVRAELDSTGLRLATEVERLTAYHEYPAQVRSALQQRGILRESSPFQFDQSDEMSLFAKKVQEMVSDLSEGFQRVAGCSKQLSSDVHAMDQLAIRMREEIAQTRTVPADLLFQRFTRTVRELSRKLEKQVELHVTGGTTPLDRVIADGLFEPLLHIIRNALAHGIESPEERRLSGKAAIASVTLQALRQGSSVEVIIRDDGRGMDLTKIRERAVALRLIDPAALPSDPDLIQLIFCSGLSTAENVDDHAGRGMGMSIVMDRLNALNGTIDVDTEPGAGTTFRMLLPLSLVVVNMVKFSVAGEHYAIPSALVDEIVDLRQSGDQDVSAGLQSDVPVVDLHTLFGLAAAPSEPRFGILTGGEGDPRLFLVDQFSGQEDTVVKPFGSFIGQHPFFSGTSLAGDGIMRLVINPASIQHQRSVPGALPHKPPPSVPQHPRVLVVDDSLSVRTYLQHLLQAQGFEVSAAANGHEALAILADVKVDSVITDLEMPGMHGYELLEHLATGAAGRPPVAVLTSRAGKEYQERATRLGATDYLVKPFDDAALLAVVRGHLENQ